MWVFFLLLSAPSCSASFTVAIIESTKNDGSPGKQRNNSLPTVHFSRIFMHVLSPPPPVE